MTTQSVTYSTYFNLITQTQSLEPGQGSMLVQLTTPNAPSIEQRDAIIQRLANATALDAVMHTSTATSRNYCAHEKLCGRDHWDNCKRHLTPAETEECRELRKQVSPFLEMDGHAAMTGLKIPRGEVDLMRRILTSVRNSLQPVK